MGSPKEPKPVKYFVALLSRGTDFLSVAEEDLAGIFGAIDSRSQTLPWVLSRFYEAEMGAGLLRRFVSFEQLRSPAELAEAKLATQKIEEKHRDSSVRRGRRVNLDPGYLEAGNVVLASTKNASHRIYLRGGIYAEASLLYHDGAFHGCPYTYRDYLWPQTLEYLTALRELYLDQLRRGG